MPAATDFRDGGWLRILHAFGLVVLQPVVPLATLVAYHRWIYSSDEKLRTLGAGQLLQIGATGAVALLAVVGLALLAAGRVSPRALGWRRDSPGRVLILGVAGAAGCVSAVLLAVALFGGDGDLGRGLHQIASYAPSQRALFAIVGLEIALLEESIFRGYLQPILIKRTGTAGGIAITATIYALYHLPNISVPRVFNRIIQGAIYGAMRGRDRSLLAPALAHALYWSIVGLL